MFSFFRRIFGAGPDTSGDTPPGESIEERLKELEAEAAAEAAGFKGVPLNRAGDLCFRVGEVDRALDYLGRAIDAYLADEQPEAARAVARKIIRLHPHAVRTLCTVTWLDLSSGHLGDALLHLGEYVEGARRGERETLARDQVMKMAEAIADEHFRKTVAQGLDDLGFPDDAKTVREWADSDDPPPGAGETAEELRAFCFAAAVSSNASRDAAG